MPYVILGTALADLSGAGSRLVLDAVTVSDYSGLGAFTGTATAAADGEPTAQDPPGLLANLPHFVVLSGPCTVVEGGRCVGRWPGGYLPSEDCAISVGGAGGALGACPVFDTYHSSTSDIESGYGDYLTLPDGSAHSGAACPAGAVLAGGQTLAWHSDGSSQGSDGDGLPRSTHGAGGGWQICF